LPAIKRKELLRTCIKCLLIVGMPANHGIDTTLKMGIYHRARKLGLDLIRIAYTGLLF